MILWRILIVINLCIRTEEHSFVSSELRGNGEGHIGDAPMLHVDDVAIDQIDVEAFPSETSRDIAVDHDMRLGSNPATHISNILNTVKAGRDLLFGFSKQE